MNGLRVYNSVNSVEESGLLCLVCTYERNVCRVAENGWVADGSISMLERNGSERERERTR